MERIKFIHCSDMHFDTPFSGLTPEKSAIRKDELRINFSNIIRLCDKKKANLLLICGDLFDSTKITDETFNFLKKSFESIPDVRIFISPGNHDPYMPGSCYEINQWPSNVHVFKDSEVSVLSFDDLKLNVYGCGFTAPYIERNLIEDLSYKYAGNHDKYVNIMVMHGTVTRTLQDCTYNPISLKSIKASGMDYIALGHTHEFTKPEKAENTYYAYSGSSEGRGFDELNEKGVIYGEIEKNISSGKAKLLFDWEFVPCSIRKYIEIDIDLSGVSTHEEASLTILENIPENRNLYKVYLSGILKDGFLLDMRILYSRFSEKYFLIKFIDRTSTEIDLESLSRESMLRGIFARKLMAKIEEAQKKGNTKEESLYTDALAAGLKAFEGEVPVYDN